MERMFGSMLNIKQRNHAQNCWAVYMARWAEKSVRPNYR